MKHSIRLNFLTASIIKQKLRLKEPVSWFPYPAMISIFFVLLCNGQIVPELNPRLGTPANVLSFNGEPSSEGSIWISVTLIKNKIVITTDNRDVITWNADDQSTDVSKPLTKFFQDRIKRIMLSATLTKHPGKQGSLVILAIDQSLKYIHLLPILESLAQSGISEYAFETKIPI